MIETPFVCTVCKSRYSKQEFEEISTKQETIGFREFHCIICGAMSFTFVFNVDSYVVNTPDFLKRKE